MDGFILQTRYVGSPEVMAAQQVALMDGLPVTWLEAGDGGALTATWDSRWNNYLPIGSVEFLRLMMERMGLSEPDSIDYPDALENHLGRKVRRAMLASAGLDEWVKPVRTKAFEPGTGIEVMNGRAPRNAEVWVSEPKQWQSEHRVYVLHGDVVGIAQYNEDGPDEELAAHDHEAIERMIADWNDAPAAYALDVGRSVGGGLDLIEVNDAWATGRYPKGIEPRPYLNWLATRWQEIKQHQKEEAL